MRRRDEESGFVREERRRSSEEGEKTLDLGRQSARPGAAAGAVTAVATGTPSALQCLDLLNLKAGKGRWEERKSEKIGDCSAATGQERPRSPVATMYRLAVFSQTRYLHDLPSRLLCSGITNLGRARHLRASASIFNAVDLYPEVGYSVCKRKYLALPA